LLEVISTVVRVIRIVSMVFRAIRVVWGIRIVSRVVGLLQLLVLIGLTIAEGIRVIMIMCYS
jgi:hypothetical protein